MQAALSISATGAGHFARRRVSSHQAAPRLEPLHGAHPLRTACEAFIAARFQRAHGASVAHFSPHLLGLRDALGRWRAASGYAPADAGRLFLEQYLDAPVEQTLSAAHGRPVARATIVEVGNLAAATPGMARVLIPLLAHHLDRLGYTWVVFTATRALRNSFRRLGLQPLVIAAAAPERLAGGSTQWGTYYNQDPLVMAGRIRCGMVAALSA